MRALFRAACDRGSRICVLLFAQHTKVVLGWDKTEDKRSKLLKRRVDADAVAEDDLRAYLGSDSDREEEEEASKRDAYRSTLLAGVEVSGTTRVPGPVYV